MEAKAVAKVGNHISNLSPLKLADDPKVANKFISLFNAVHGAKHGETFYNAEKFNFVKVLQENEALQKCDKISLYGAFLDVAVNGLSFDPTKNLVYLVPYNVNIGTKENAKWIQKVKVHISPYGELLIRQKCGQIKHADNPVLVYEGDSFKVTTTEAGTKVYHEANFGKRSGKLVACFLRIVRNDDSVDFKIMTVEELEIIRKSSKTGDGPAWTNAYGGMLMAKTIKHAFKTYPKVRIGQFSELESTVEDTTGELDYGLDSDEGSSMQEYEDLENGEPVVMEEAEEVSAMAEQDDDTF